MSVNIISIICLCSQLLLFRANSVHRARRSLSYVDLRLWTNNTVPYSFSEGFSDYELFHIKKAIQTYNEETCLKFEPFDSARHSNWIQFEDSNDCFSDIGMMGSGNQRVRLSRYCRNYGLVLHELAHVIGLLHEMMRPDRDRFITVHTANLQQEAVVGFQKLSSKEARRWNQAGDHQVFDFQSITMYSPFDFSRNGLPVWTKLNSSDETPIFETREKDISFLDIKSINEMYQCAKKCEATNCTYPSFLKQNCECQTVEEFADRRCVDDSNYAVVCGNASSTNFCYTNPVFASVVCRNTCGRCFQPEDSDFNNPPPFACLDKDEQDCDRRRQDGYCYIDTWTRVNCRRSCNRCQLVSDNESHSGIGYSCKDRHDPDLCADWAHRGHCISNAGFMLASCASSCGSCNNSRTTTPLPCHNYSPDSYCDTIASQGKCQGTTLKLCLGSCGRCGHNYTRQSTTPTAVLASTSTPEMCEDHIPDCRYYVDLGYCHNHQESMEHYCAKSCIFCGQKLCLDEDSFNVCEDVKRRGLCRYRNELTIRCQKTCGFCSQVTSTKPATRLDPNSTPKVCNNQDKSEECVKKQVKQLSCKDESDQSTCQSWSDSGYCYQNEEYMRSNCAMTCRFCAHNSKETQVKHLKCKDKEEQSTCQAWSDSGYCYQNEEYMRSHCARTCKFCVPNSKEIQGQQQYQCKDSEGSSTCESWRDNGYCSQNEDYMKENCAKTCKFCSNMDSLQGDEGCLNSEPDSHCQAWRKYGYCQQAHVAEVCQKSCGLC